MPSITDKGYSVIFEKNQALIKREDRSMILAATKRNQLYVVNEKIERVMMAENEHNKNLLKWHQRYVHVNINDLKKMRAEGMVDGMNL